MSRKMLNKIIVVLICQSFHWRSSHGCASPLTPLEIPKPLAYWPLNVHHGVHDVSGSGIDGRIAGDSFRFVQGPNGDGFTALQLQMDEDKESYADFSSVRIETMTAPWTFALFVKAGSLQGPIFEFTPKNTQYGLHVWANFPGSGQLFMNPGSGNTLVVSCDFLTGWIYAALSHNGSHYALHCNNKSANIAYSTEAEIGTGRFTLGRRFSDGGVALEASFACLSIHEVALTSVQLMTVKERCKNYASKPQTRVTRTPSDIDRLPLPTNNSIVIYRPEQSLNFDNPQGVHSVWEMRGSASINMTSRIVLPKNETKCQNGSVYSILPVSASVANFRLEVDYSLKKISGNDGFAIFVVDKISTLTPTSDNAATVFGVDHKNFKGLALYLLHGNEQVAYTDFSPNRTNMQYNRTADRRINDNSTRFTPCRVNLSGSTSIATVIIQVVQNKLYIAIIDRMQTDRPVTKCVTDGDVTGLRGLLQSGRAFVGFGGQNGNSFDRTEISRVDFFELRTAVYPMPQYDYDPSNKPASYANWESDPATIVASAGAIPVTNAIMDQSIWQFRALPVNLTDIALDFKLEMAAANDSGIAIWFLDSSRRINRGNLPSYYGLYGYRKCFQGFGVILNPSGRRMSLIHSPGWNNERVTDIVPIAESACTDDVVAAVSNKTTIELSIHLIDEKFSAWFTDSNGTKFACFYDVSLARLSAAQRGLTIAVGARLMNNETNVAPRKIGLQGLIVRSTHWKQSNDSAYQILPAQELITPDPDVALPNRSNSASTIRSIGKLDVTGYNRFLTINNGGRQHADYLELGLTAEEGNARPIPPYSFGNRYSMIPMLSCWRVEAEFDVYRSNLSQVSGNGFAFYVLSGDSSIFAQAETVPNNFGLTEESARGLIVVVSPPDSTVRAAIVPSSAKLTPTLWLDSTFSKKISSPFIRETNKREILPKLIVQYDKSDRTLTIHVKGINGSVENIGEKISAPILEEIMMGPVYIGFGAHCQPSSCDSISLRPAFFDIACPYQSTTTASTTTASMMESSTVSTVKTAVTTTATAAPTTIPMSKAATTTMRPGQAYKSVVTTALQTPTLALNGSSIDPSILNDTTSEAYLKLKASLIEQMKSIYERSGMQVNDIDVTNIEFEEALQQYIATFKASVNSGQAVSKDGLNQLVKTTMAEMRKEGAFRDTFGDADFNFEALDITVSYAPQQKAASAPAIAPRTDPETQSFFDDLFRTALIGSIAAMAVITVLSFWLFCRRKPKENKLLPERRRHGKVEEENA